MTPRENATQELLHFIDMMAPGSNNRAIYEKRLNAMSQTEFEQFITRLESEEEILALFRPNLSDEKIAIERNYQVAEALGHDFFQHLELTDPDTGQLYRTPIKHLVVDLPLRRQAQMLYKKMAIAENADTVDDRSGQATGASKGARMSYPELQVNAGKGLDYSILEFIKVRGGDERAFTQARNEIISTGKASIASIQQTPTTVKANATLSQFLKAMMLDNNL